MALPTAIMTQSQEAEMFDCLDIPYTRTGYTITYDNLGTTRNSNAFSPAAAILPEIEAFFTGGLANGITYPQIDAGVLSKILYWIEEWTALGADSVEMAGSSIGGSDGAVTNIRTSSELSRKNIRSKMRNLVPFYTQYAWMLKCQGDNSSNISANSSGGNTSFVPIVR